MAKRNTSVTRGQWGRGVGESEQRRGNEKGGHRDLITVPANREECGVKPAAPIQLSPWRVRIRSRSAEEAGSRPYCGLVLCTSSLKWLPREGDRVYRRRQ